MVIVLEVDGDPVIRKLLGFGLPELPARYIFLQGKVAVPRSRAPAVPGISSVLIATEARFERATLAAVYPRAV
jgi:hypothetical protein